MISLSAFECGTANFDVPIIVNNFVVVDVVVFVVVVLGKTKGVVVCGKFVLITVVLVVGIGVVDVSSVLIMPVVDVTVVVVVVVVGATVSPLMQI